MNIHLGASDVFQVLILYLTIYAILKRARGSRFGQVLLGTGLLAVVLVASSYIFHFYVLSLIIQKLLLYLAISSVVIFQPEIRRILSTMGAFGYLDRPTHTREGAATPELVTDTITALAATHTGALIAFERGISLKSYEATGIATDAIFTRELVQTIFTPPLPLHDGGMIIRTGRIAAAHAIFPLSNNPELIASGMRHRAAAGLSEETDALVIVVSEETGAVSVAHNGRLFRYTLPESTTAIQRWVTNAMREETPHRTLISTMLKLLQKLPLYSRKGKTA